MTPTLAAVGDNCLDVYLSYDALMVGGNALNVAAQWRQDGRAARYFGVVGDDLEGGIVLDQVTAAGLSADDVERRAGQTGVTLLSHQHGDRAFLLEDLGVGERYVPSEAAYGQLREADWVHLGTNSSPDLVRRLVADGVRFSVDISTVSDAIPLDGVPLVFASGPADADEPVEPLLRSLLRAGAGSVVVTCGRRGSFFADAAATIHEPATTVEVIDTCGAGDSFIAAYLGSSFVHRRSAADSLRQASAAAGRTCTHLGGFPQQPRAVPDWLLTKYAAYVGPVPGPKGC